MPTILFIEPGSCATQDLSFYQTTYGVGTGATATSDATPVALSPRSIKCTSGTGSTANYAMVESTAIPTVAAGRVSFYFRYAGTPYTAAPGCAFFCLKGLSTTGPYILTLALNATGNIVLLDNTLTINSTGATVLAANTDYRISVAYTTLASATNAVKVFVNGLLEISTTNIPLTSNTLQSLRYGIGMVATPVNASASTYFAHIYVDNGTAANGDPGDVHVTAKRPVANGSSNNFTTQVGTGGSGYGTGNAPQVNEQPRSNANGWSVVLTSSVIIEEYTVEAQAVGDINIPSNATIVGSGGWTCGSTSPTTATVGTLAPGNSPLNATVAVATSIPRLNLTNTSTYPSTLNACGYSTNTSTPGTTLTLFECGVLIAYTPAVYALVTRSREQYRTRGLLSAPTRPRLRLAAVLRSCTIGREFVKAPARSVAQAKPLTRARLASVTIAAQAIKSVFKGSARIQMQGKSLLRTPTRTRMQGKSLIWGGARGLFKSQAPGHLSAASPFTLKAILSTRGLGSQRVRGMLKSSTQIRLNSQAPLRTVTRARFSSHLLITTLHRVASRLSARFVAPARSVVSTRALFTALARATQRVRLRLLTWAWMQTMTRAASQTHTRSSFTTIALQRFALRLIAEAVLRSRHATRSRMRYTITKTFTGVTLMFITFAEVRPTGYSGGIKPNTTCATQLTVTDQNGSPVNGLLQCNVSVTDPLGNVAAYTLGDAIISRPGGIYWCTYNTTGEGIYTELWSLIAPDGVEIASHRNTFRVAY